MVFLILLLLFALWLTNRYDADNNIFVQLIGVIIIIIYVVLAWIYNWEIPVRY